jgi:hypothetical protein
LVGSQDTRSAGSLQAGGARRRRRAASGEAAACHAAKRACRLAGPARAAHWLAQLPRAHVPPACAAPASSPATTGSYSLHSSYTWHCLSTGEGPHRANAFDLSGCLLRLPDARRWQPPISSSTAHPTPSSSAALGLLQSRPAPARALWLDRPPQRRPPAPRLPPQAGTHSLMKKSKSPSSSFAWYRSFFSAIASPASCAAAASHRLYASWSLDVSPKPLGFV